MGLVRFPPAFREVAVPSTRSTRFITSSYHSNTSKRSKLRPSHLTFTGFAAQFDNRSPEPLWLFWDDAHSNRATLIGEIAPLKRLGTATIPGQAFFLTPVHGRSHKVVRWVVTAETAVYVYDPSSTHTLEQLDEQQVSAQWKNAEQERLYDMLRLHDEFACYILNDTGWRPFPVPCPFTTRGLPSFFSQTHCVVLPDTAFSETKNNNNKIHQSDQLTLKVVSVTLRVFEIERFLTPDECNARGIGDEQFDGRWWRIRDKHSVCWQHSQTATRFVHTVVLQYLVRTIRCREQFD
jgi:hypothetical protein